MRSRGRDWSPVLLASDPTPGLVDAVASLAMDLDGRTESLRRRADLLNQVLGTVAAPFWSGLAADAFSERLRTLKDAIARAATQHGEAASACRRWANAMFVAQYAADRALLAAEDAQRDLAIARTSLSALTGDHPALRSALTVESLTAARHTFGGAQQRLHEARARAQAAKQDYDRGEDVFVHQLEATLTGSLARSSQPELRDVASMFGVLAVVDLTATSAAAALMEILKRLTPAQLQLLLSDQPGLVQRFWNNPPDPAQVASWWSSLTNDMRASMIAKAPAIIGNLPGIPFIDRDTANRISLASAKQNRQPTSEQAAVLAQMGKALKSPDGGTAVQLVAFNFWSQPPMVAVGYGDLDRSTSTTWCAPGMDSDADDALSDWSTAATNLYKEQGRFAGARAVVAWLGYDTPGLDTVSSSDLAKSGAGRFAAELDGNNATRAAGSTGPTAIGVVAHSYGTTMAAIALTKTKTEISSFTMVGSAGIDTSLVPSLSSIHADHLYTTAASQDGLAPFGAAVSGRAEPNPSVARAIGHAIGGAESFSSEGNGKDLQPVDGHGATGTAGSTKHSGLLNANPSEHHGYFDDRTQSLRNIAAVSAGHPEAVDGGLTSTTAAARQHNQFIDALNTVPGPLGMR